MLAVPLTYFYLYEQETLPPPGGLSPRNERPETLVGSADSSVLGLNKA